MLNIPDISFYSSFYLKSFLCLSSKSHNLAPTGNPRLHLMPYHIPLYGMCIFFCMLQHMRPRTNHTHLSQKDINKLWQFINIIFSHNVSPPSHPRVILYRLPSVRVRIQFHASKLKAHKFLAIKPGALLSEK